MYIAVLDEAPDYMVPTLVAHSMLNAHEYFTDEYRTEDQLDIYHDWKTQSFRKVVVRANRKVFDKIRGTLLCWAGHENTICNAEPSCLVVLPVDSDNVPNVLKYCSLWKPLVETPPKPRDTPLAFAKQVDYRALPEHTQKLVAGMSLQNFYNLERYFKSHAALESGVYVVQPGDTLSAIGQDVGIDWQELARINRLENPSLIHPGQPIYLR
jgi:hypothetical protein